MLDEREYVERMEREFVEKFVTMKEIGDFFKVTPPAVVAMRDSGKLPGYFKVKGVGVYLWERERITPILERLALDREG